MSTIIVQDTSPDIADILSTALTLENFTVHKFTRCGNELHRTVATVKPGVVILDFDELRKRGVDPCKRIKDNHPTLPVIALSDNNNIKSTYSLYGFDDYITKPFDLNILYKVVKKYMS